MDCEHEVRDFYDEKHSKTYRNEDELVIQYGSRVHYCDVLREISGSFGHEISVLDVGCGTGRYFHCLTSVKKLLGIDISSYMLEKARDPVKKEEIDVGDIELLCGDIFDTNISNRLFDFIYSTGVLGECSPFNLCICNKLFELLKPNGKLFFTVTDTHSRMQDLGDEQSNIGMRALRKFFPILPLISRRYVNRRLSSFYMTKEEIEEILKKSAFAKCEVERYEHPTGSGWQGAHYDCLAFKESDA